MFDTDTVRVEVGVIPLVNVTVFGFIEGVMPLVEEDALRLTVPEKPFALLIVMVELPVPPLGVTDEGLAETAKSVNETVVWAEGHVAHDAVTVAVPTPVEVIFTEQDQVLSVVQFEEERVPRDVMNDTVLAAA